MWHIVAPNTCDMGINRARVAPNKWTASPYGVVTRA